ncbi:MAG: DUF167 domain-containing protein [SAR202 cluster bacterium]|nr:DUF167 domain-containing protein [SAR202 cluster bacterium]
MPRTAQPEQPKAEPPKATLKVRVQPRASTNAVESFDGTTLRLRVTAPPEEGKANAAVTALLAEALGIARIRVQIVRGHTSRNKLVVIQSLTLEEALQRLGPGPRAGPHPRPPV